MYELMDKDGMLPDWVTCKGCGCELGKVKAERYLGTYNGLCYPCTNKPYYITRRYQLDNAIQLSYPPHSPAWRRDRETYTSYEDCEDCNGLGQHLKYGSFFNSYRVQCKTCSNKFYNHPVRKQRQEYIEAERERVTIYGKTKVFERCISELNIYIKSWKMGDLKPKKGMIIVKKKDDLTEEQIAKVEIIQREESAIWSESINRIYQEEDNLDIWEETS